MSSIDVSTLIHRMVLVRVRPDEFKGTQPIVVAGFWEGIVENVFPKVVEDKVIDQVLSVRLEFGHARLGKVIEIPFSDPGWKLRYPWKGER